MPWEGEQASAGGTYRPSSAARLNYLDYLLSEPRMDEVLEAVAALEDDQRRILVAFLQRMSRGDRLTLDRRRRALTLAHDSEKLQAYSQTKRNDL